MENPVMINKKKNKKWNENGSYIQSSIGNDQDSRLEITIN